MVSLSTSILHECIIVTLGQTREMQNNDHQERKIPIYIAME